MQVFLLTALTMLAFAANSLLNRAGVAAGGLDPVSFATLRLAAGAFVLIFLTLALRRRFRLFARGRIVGVPGLLAYVYGFSLAYTALDAGLGALILFGCVQITMFLVSLAQGERPPLTRWLGAALAFGGLVWLVWPGSTGLAPDPLFTVLMALAGIGWGFYSINGRGAQDPLGETAGNFALAALVGLAISLATLPASASFANEWPWQALLLAALSGAVTSGLGYALWYSVLPRLPGSTAAVAQLSVPVIAMLGGAVMLGEAVSFKLALAAGVVLGGVALAVLPLSQMLQRKSGSKAS